MTATPRSSPSVGAQALGYGGLLPFVGLALAVWVLPPAQQAWAAFALLAYGATILSFRGAIHWGLAMRSPAGPGTGLLVWGVLPSLLAWLALLLPVAAGLLLVAAGLVLCFAVDRRIYTPMGLHAWLPMRLLLTLVALLCCIAAAWCCRGGAA